MCAHTHTCVYVSMCTCMQVFTEARRYWSSDDCEVSDVGARSQTWVPARTVCPLDISLVPPHNSSNFQVSASQGEKWGHNEWTHFPMPGSCSQTNNAWHHCMALVKASHLYHDQKQVRAVCGYYTHHGSLYSEEQALERQVTRKHPKVILNHLLL